MKKLSIKSESISAALISAAGIIELAALLAAVLVLSCAAPANAMAGKPRDNSGLSGGVVKEKRQDPARDRLRQEATPLMKKNERQRLEGIHYDDAVTNDRPDLLEEVKKTGRDAGWYSPGGLRMMNPSPVEPEGVKIARRARLIVIGAVTEAHSFLNEHNTFVFTENNVEVQEVLKNETGEEISFGSHIFVTRPGGTILVGDHLIYNDNGDQSPLAPTTQCLFFLEPLPDVTGAFCGRSYLVEGNLVKDADHGGEDFESLDQVRSQVGVAARNALGGTDDQVRAEATPLAAKNDRQRIEGQIYDTPVTPDSPNMLEQVTKTGRDAGWFSPVSATIGSPSVSEPVGVTLARQSPLIVIGEIVDRHSLLSDHYTHVFTESEVRVVEVLKNESDSAVAVGSHIFLARPGGAVVVDGHLISDITAGTRSLRKGDWCLLLLNAIPGDPNVFNGHSYILDGSAADNADDSGADFASLGQARQYINRAIGGAKQ